MVANDLRSDHSDDTPTPAADPDQRPDRSLSAGDVTMILSAIEQGDGGAAEQLLPLVYEELRKLAAGKMAQEKPGQMLQATALVHEAYIRLVDADKAQHWNSRGHFFASAAEAMRRILIESARRKRRMRGDGATDRIEWKEVSLIVDPDRDDLLDLDATLTRFAHIDPHTADLVKLRVFAGLSNEEAAALQHLPPSTAKKHWMYARAWLRREMAADGDL